MWKFNWLSFMCAINDHKLIVIIVKSVNIHIHFILCRKSFLPAYAQLGMLGTIFAMVPLVALTITARVTEQTKCYTSTPTSTSLRMVDPEIFSVNSNLQTFFYTFLTPPHPSDDKIKELLLLYIAKLQVKREYILSLWTLYIDNVIGKFDLKTVSLG